MHVGEGGFEVFLVGLRQAAGHVDADGCGQKFIESTLPKIRALRTAIDALRKPIDLVVDGGVGPDTIERVAMHGANVFVMGSAFFKSPDYKTFVDGIRAQLAKLGSGGR